MGWLDTLLDRANEAKAPEPMPVAAVKPREPTPEVKSTWFQVRPPFNGDLGHIETAFYYVSSGVLTLCDESGKPLGRKCRLGRDDNEKVIASRLAKQAWKSRETDFSGPLQFERLGIA